MKIFVGSKQENAIFSAAYYDLGVAFYEGQSLFDPQVIVRWCNHQGWNVEYHEELVIVEDENFASYTSCFYTVPEDEALLFALKFNL